MLKLPEIKSIIQYLPSEPIEYRELSPERIEEEVFDVNLFSETTVLPRTPNEVIRNSSKFVKTRAGKKSKAYSISDLQTIARNLKLPSSGSKGDLIDRIQDFAKKNAS